MNILFKIKMVVDKTSVKKKIKMNLNKTQIDNDWIS